MSLCIFLARSGEIYKAARIDAGVETTWQFVEVFIWTFLGQFSARFGSQAQANLASGEALAVAEAAVDPKRIWRWFEMWILSTGLCGAFKHHLWSPWRQILSFTAGECCFCFLSYASYIHLNHWSVHSRSWGKAETDSTFWAATFHLDTGRAFAHSLSNCTGGLERGSQVWSETSGTAFIIILHDI